ncbi:MAG: HAD family hydrolase [Melioribacteraceae bacterium]|nr:HAD family hydrolase [Melioribacteraceae bacterium]
MKKNNKTKAVVFDLDGTLVQSHETIYYSMMNAFKALNIHAEVPLEEFSDFIGLHFDDIFKNFGVTVPDFEEFLTIYKEFYAENLNTSKLYPGVVEILESLRKQKIRIALLTTKGQDQAEFILKHFELDKYFNMIMGRTPAIEVKPSPESLFIICHEFRVEPSEIIMVGDSEMDIRCGKNAGSKTCAVSFGYRTVEAIKKEKPDFIINELLQIEKHL